MTLQQWLQEATGDSPAGVQRRLAQEYRAHLDESVAAGGVSDPVALFGEPEVTERQLQKSYVHAGRISELKSTTDFYFWLSAVFSLCVTAFALIYMDNTPLRIAAAVNLGVMLFIWRWTLSWPRIRRATFRKLVSWPLASLFAFVLVALTGSGVHLTHAVIFISVCSATLGGFREDARLRRTLALEATA
jgi:hypothetical protein